MHTPSKKAWIIGAAIVATALATPETRSAQAKELILNNYLPTRTPIYIGTLRRLKQRLEKESNGEIKVTIPATTLGPQWKQWQLVETGVADIALVPNYSQRQRIFLPTVAELPLLTKTVESASGALWATQQKYFGPANEYKGVKQITLALLSSRHIANNQRPIEKADDVKGLKIWTQAGVLLSVVKTLGGIGVTAPYPKLFELASKGNIDGMTIASDTLLASRTMPYVSHLTQIPGGLGNVSFSVIMNQSTWNDLSAKNKDAVMRAQQDLAAAGGKTIDAAVAKARGVVNAKGVKIIKASDTFVAELEKKLAFIRTDWVEKAKKKGLPNAQEALDFYIAEMNRRAK